MAMTAASRVPESAGQTDSERSPFARLAELLAPYQPGKHKIADYAVEAQMQLQQWSDAQWAFEEAAKVEPGNPKAYLGAGSALNEQKNYVEAQKALQHSLEIRPDSAEAHYELARSLWGLGKWQLAEPHVRHAIELNKDYAGPHALMGNIDIEREDPEAALAEFEECLRLDPDGSLAPSVKEIIAQLKKALGKE